MATLLTTTASHVETVHFQVCIVGDGVDEDRYFRAGLGCWQQADGYPFFLSLPERALRVVDLETVHFVQNMLVAKFNFQMIRPVLECDYYNDDSLEVLHEGMFAGKYFDKDAGTFKLVYYPAMGQTRPE